MPLWHIHHPENGFSADDRRGIAQAVTGIYAPFMPRFYVNVLFHAVPAGSLYIGGEVNDNFVRIWADHIARRVPDDDTAARFLGAVDRLLAPWIVDRGYEWEFHADETPFRLWSVQGILPPVEGSDDFARWKSENRASARMPADRAATSPDFTESRRPA